MASIFYMKFNDHQGALIADEMTWHLSFKYGYRPTRYGDNILNLVDGKTAEDNDFAAVYSGVGFPSMHFEIAEKTKKAIKKDPKCIGDLERTAFKASDIYQEVHGRMINDKMRFMLGFDRDEMNQGKFKFEGKEYEIKQESVKAEARKVLKNQISSDAFHRIFDNEGLVMGYDTENGINAFQIDHSGCSLTFAYPFDAIGPGKEIGTKIYAEISSRMHLDERRKGFDFLEGLFILMNTFIEAYDFSVKTGGYLQLFMIDGKKDHLKNLTAESSGHECYLAGEVVRAYRWGFITKKDAIKLVEKLVIKNEEWEPVEAEMFKASKDGEKLRRYLMGFRASESPLRPMV